MVSHFDRPEAGCCGWCSMIGDILSSKSHRIRLGNGAVALCCCCCMCLKFGGKSLSIEQAMVLRGSLIKIVTKMVGVWKKLIENDNNLLSSWAGSTFHFLFSIFHLLISYSFSCLFFVFLLCFVLSYLSIFLSFILFFSSLINLFLCSMLSFLLINLH